MSTFVPKQFFLGIEICIFADKEQYDYRTYELAEAVEEAGGTVIFGDPSKPLTNILLKAYVIKTSFHFIFIGTTTYCVVADNRKDERILNLSPNSFWDIVHVDWLLDCILEGELLPFSCFRKNYSIVSSQISDLFELKRAE